MITNLKCHNCNWVGGTAGEGAIQHVENNSTHRITGTTSDGGDVTIEIVDDREEI